jgi:spoIIIJ-associated protein
MSEGREFNAANVQEAIDKAASALGVSQDGLSYEILDEGSSGFLGLGARDARISVTVPSEDEQPVFEPEPTLAEEPSPSEEPNEELEDASVESVQIEREERQPGDPEEPEKLEKLEKSEEPGRASEELLAEIRERVENTLDAMEFDNKLEIRDDEEIVTVNIESEDAGLLIGQKGETLDAIQHLVNLSVHRVHQHPKRVVLDCEGYRERRVKAVQGMAHRTAKRVVKEDKAVALPPMSSSERRAVHSYLKDNPKVITSSSGNDENRHVTIAPLQS